ncbi:hypothetical protein HG535_0B03350 [Zygotorulaspora mrakii]|uniref:C2H2-type domain-containing protein n=1 Tax=Zygotorulaspora mrakii TaxID=42260 RepID=A0A7H9AYF7_ZYGMR|nr:uncharacterized protein HG535_0B03350 [Zygotorulaspora mrakii]QLG71296.1 hypothetical protein HG535_0B03350 [Zygotorulaspora mrakii]
MKKSTDDISMDVTSLSDITSKTISTNEDGRFKCPFPNCNKSFTRQEHLSRHKLNHWPKEIFRCSYIYPDTGLACNRTFVRKDLLSRHEKRHEKQGGRLSNHHSAPATLVANGEDNQFLNAATSRTGTLYSVSNITSEEKQIELPLNNTTAETQQSSETLENAILDYRVTAEQQPSIGDHSGSESVNRLFSWLFEANYSQPQLGGQYHSINKNNSAGSQLLNKSGATSHSSPVDLAGNTQSSLFHGIEDIGGKQKESSKATSPVVLQKTSDETSKQFSQPQHLYESNVTSLPSNQMQDLFSLEMLNNDPLDALMQELSAPSMESQNSTGLEKTSMSHSRVSTRAEDKCKDSHRANIKDNFEVQKSNILELQENSPDTKKKFESSGNSASKTSKNYKKKIRSTMMPSFFHPDPKSKYAISGQKCEDLYQLVPDLREIPIENLQRSLLSFWFNFHPQYGLLHKPSFHVDQQPAILVLALIMIGASFLGSESRKTTSDVICIPLRWIIFSNEDFQPPSKTYIIQSLLLLECYEKASTNRYLHERSYLHHGTTIQLLRRTPSLGGHPLRLKPEERPDGIQDPQEVYRLWIDCEMLKRVALYAFYMDTTHAAVFGYANLFINCSQVQLMLPCSDIVWESYDLSYEKLLDHGFGKERMTFLSGLKELLSEVIETLQRAAKHQPQLGATDVTIKSWDIKSVLGRKVLLAGVISTMFQCQETNVDLFASMSRGSFGDEDHPNRSLQDILSFTINYWLFKVQKSYQDPDHCFIESVDSAEDSIEPTKGADVTLDHTNILGLDGRARCKIPEYYMAQIMLRIFHHDYYIFGGAPWRMNVKTGEEEYALASKHILQFASDSSVGDVALVYSYQFLFEMFVDEDTLQVNADSYSPNSDYIITRPNTLALLTLLIWTCSFVLYGSEVTLWNNKQHESVDSISTVDGTIYTKENELLKQTYIPKESFENHLIRMYSFLRIKPSSDVVTYHNSIREKAALLKSIGGRNNLCGMMKHMRNIFAQSYWDLGREFSKLFDNCFERSLGKASPTCINMYKV